MTDLDLELKARILCEKVKHYLVTATNHILDEASDYEFYLAFAYALREEIIMNWAATTQTIASHDQRRLYYLSMEYLPGRIMSNTITNLCATDLVGQVLKNLGRDLSSLVRLEKDPGLGNGGLGRLASCFLDSLATHHYPAMGYGLRYQYGIFDQELWDGVQVERPDTWLLLENPWQRRRDFYAVEVNYCGRTIERTNDHGETVHDLQGGEEVRALPYDTPIIGYCKASNFSVVTLRMWTTKESPRNFQLQRYNAGRLDQASENTTLTDVLYPSDYHEFGKRVRLKQEFLLVSASIQDICRQHLEHHENFDTFTDKVHIQINDTHPAIAIAELMRIFHHDHDIPWKKAWETTQTCMGYTNHTVMKEALEEWDQSLVSYLLPRQYHIIERINQDFCESIRAKYPQDEEKLRKLSIFGEEGRVKMAHLSIIGSSKINGVAKLHSEILKSSVFSDFYEMYPDRFTNVTNGVTPRRWLLHCNPHLSDFITHRIGPEWITDFSHIRTLENFAEDPQSQQEFVEIKQANKERLAHFVKEKNLIRDQNGQPIEGGLILEIDSLFDIHIKRMHEYKRQLLNALHAIILYHELLEDPDSRKIKRTIIIGGKAAPSYHMAKHVIRFIHCLARTINNEPALNGSLKMVFIENYNVSKAEILIPAADLSEQISTAGTEASGTGNMKLSMNGALTIGTDDGANIEMREEIGDKWWPFLFGCSAEEIAELKLTEQYNAWNIYHEFPKIGRALDALIDRSLTQNEDEHQTLCQLHESLLESHYGALPDPYFILKDLIHYYETQKKVEELYSQPLKWAQFALHNIAGMGKFSSDRSIQDYAQKIWNITPAPLDITILNEIRSEYAEAIPTLLTF